MDELEKNLREATRAYVEARYQESFRQALATTEDRGWVAVVALREAVMLANGIHANECNRITRATDDYK